MPLKTHPPLSRKRGNPLICRVCFVTVYFWINFDLQNDIFEFVVNYKVEVFRVCFPWLQESDQLDIFQFWIL